jgi:hypothetical protein
LDRKKKKETIQKVKLCELLLLISFRCELRETSSHHEHHVAMEILKDGEPSLPKVVWESFGEEVDDLNRTVTERL